MFFEVEEVKEIIKEIVEGVEAAQRAGVDCGSPESFTVTKMIGANKVTATFPIWNEKQSPDTDKK